LSGIGDCRLKDEAMCRLLEVAANLKHASPPRAPDNHGFVSVNADIWGASSRLMARIKSSASGSFASIA
jgi:hypothetical protein